MSIGLIVLCYAASAMAGLLFAGWWAAFAAPCLLAGVFLGVFIRPGGPTPTARALCLRARPVAIEDDELEPSGFRTSSWGGADAPNFLDDDDFHPSFSLCQSSDAFPDTVWLTVNAATGLPMVNGMGGVDVGGHIYGFSD